MRVLLVTNMYPENDESHYGVFVREYVESMRNLNVGIDVFFTDGRGSPVEYVSRIPKLAKVISEGAYDLIHAQHTYCVFQVLLTRLLGARRLPMMLTLHEGETLAPRVASSGGRKMLKRLVYSRRLKAAAARRVDYIVGVEPRILEALGIEVPHSIIPPGVDTRLFTPRERTTCRAELGFTAAEKLVLFPASPTKAKGYELFQHAVASLKTAARAVVGGAIPRRLMPTYMSAADVVVQTSLFEASPMVVKEAMAVGAPIVSTDVGDSRMIIGGTDGCFICPSTSEGISQGIEAALHFGRRTDGAARIQELGLTLEDVARRYRALYEELLSTWRGRR